MKLTNKKTTNCNHTTTTLNHTPTNPTKHFFKILHITSTQPKRLNLQTTLSRPEENKRLEIEAEQKQNQARTYAGVFPPR